MGSPRRLIVCFYWVQLALLGLCWSHLAEAAKKRVVVLPFSGVKGAAARGGLVGALGRSVTMVSAGDFNNTADELGVERTEPSGMVEICAKLKCDAVIKGSVSKKGRRFTLAVTVYDGGTGESIGRRAATIRGVTRIGPAGSAIGSRLGGIIAKGKFRKGQGRVKPPEPKPEPAPEPAARRDDVSDIPVYKPPAPEKKVRHASRRRAKVEEDDSDDEGGDEEDQPSRKHRHASTKGLLDISLALGLSARKALVAGSDPANDSLYEGGMYPEFTLRADVYPIAPFTDNFARNIGLGVSYTRHLTISTKQTNSADPPVDTSSQELLIDLRARWNLLDKPTSPELSFFIGYGMRDFALSPNLIMSSFNYRFVRIGAEGIIPLGTPLFSLLLGADARPLMSTGTQAEESYGPRQGGLGYSFRGGACGKLPLGVFYFLVFEYLRFGPQFGGADPNDPRGRLKDWPEIFEPTSAIDRFIRVWAGGGYSL
jgi:hypothetical protein